MCGNGGTTVSRRWSWILLSLALAAGFLSCIVVRMFNPARQPPERIRGERVEHTPVGTPSEDVLAFVQRQGWRYRTHEPGTAGYESKTLIAEYGGYQGIPWWVWHEAAWQFDENGRLKLIYISTWE